MNERCCRVILKDNKIQVFTDWPSRLYFESPDMSDEELDRLYEALEERYMERQRKIARDSLSKRIKGFA